VAAPNRRSTIPRPHTISEDGCSIVDFPRLIPGERRDKESPSGLVAIACRLLLISPCHAALARESWRRDLKPLEFKRARTISSLLTSSRARSYVFMKAFSALQIVVVVDVNLDLAFGAAPNVGTPDKPTESCHGLPKCHDPPTSLPPSTARHPSPATLHSGWTLHVLHVCLKKTWAIQRLRLTRPNPAEQATPLRAFAVQSAVR
jgi:hypothetical protein